MIENLRDVSVIKKFHAHVYYHDHTTREIAYELQKILYSFKKINVGFLNLHDKTYGPHKQPMFTVEFKTKKQLSFVLKFLMLNRNGLSILIHPVTGNSLEDHTTNAIWLGEKLDLDLSKV